MALRIACLFLGVLLCADCAAPAASPRATTRYLALAWYDRFDEVLEGTIDYDPALHLGFVDLTSQVGSMRCVGPLHVVRLLPTGAHGTPECAGARGAAKLECSDGREISSSWSTENGCSQGQGKGKDSLGAELHFAFGLTPTMQQTTLADALRQQKGKPPLPSPPPPGEAQTATRVSTSGTAFFVSRDGKLVTNHHVVSGAKTIEVVLNEQEMVEAKLRYDDPVNDLAILEVAAIRPPLALRTQHGLGKGDEVFTLGFPVPSLQGLEMKATFGHVNALSGVAGDERYLQIDVPIQPGNSGGPLFNQRGEVVGIVTATLDPKQTIATAGYVPQNVNYALKAEVVYAMLRKNLGSDFPVVRGRGEVEPIQKLVVRAEDSVVMVVVH